MLNKKLTNKKELANILKIFINVVLLCYADFMHLKANMNLSTMKFHIPSNFVCTHLNGPSYQCDTDFLNITTRQVESLIDSHIDI